MKKMKKIVALLLAMAMVMGMSLTAFAAPDPVEGTGTITVNGLSKTEDTSVTVYQVVKWNETNSEWDIVPGAESCITIPKTDADATFNWEGLRGIVGELKFAENEFVAPQTKPAVDGSVTFEGLAEGAYLVVASGTNTQYSAMGAGLYVYNNTTHLMVPGDITINAKASDYTVTKTMTDNTKSFISRGDEIEYEIKTVFPSYAEDGKEADPTSRTFTITDQPTGLTITGIKVTVGGTELTNNVEYTLKTGENVVDFSTVKEDQAVTVDFENSYINATPNHAGETVVVTVTAKATGNPSTKTYSNKATTNKAGNPSTDVTSTTGSITIKKTDTAGNALTGAIFNVKLGETILTFVPSGDKDGEYMLAQGTEAGDKNVGGTDIHTIVLKGLGEGTYSIEEVQAPDGYSINNEIKTDVKVIAEDNANIEWNVEDTKLSSLPSTGGIGTTIFTIGGCLIMIVAAGLFFATRKKSAK